MKPLNGNVFVVQEVKEEKTASGLYIGKTKLESGLEPGVVVSVGPDVAAVNAGDRIYLKWSDAVPVTHEGQAGAIIDQKSILAVI